jgi:hypothetical protein
LHVVTKNDGQARRRAAEVTSANRAGELATGDQAGRPEDFILSLTATIADHAAHQRQKLTPLRSGQPRQQLEQGGAVDVGRCSTWPSGWPSNFRSFIFVRGFCRFPTDF